MLLPDIRAFSRRNLVGPLFLLPTLFFLVTFFLVPLGTVFVQSVQRVRFMQDSIFVGWENYQRLLFSDSEFWLAVYHTFSAALLYMPARMILAIALAVFLNKSLKGTTLFRAVYFLPVTISFVVAAYMWNWILQDSYGVLNYLMLQAGILESPIDWFRTAWRGRMSVTLAMTWQDTGFIMLIILAGLQAIPQHLYEASAIDGASRWQSHRYITIPQLRSYIGLGLVLTLTRIFKVFVPYFIMTGGYPANQTQTLVMYLRKVAFDRYQLGYAAALSVVLMLALLVMSFLQLKVVGKTEAD